MLRSDGIGKWREVCMTVGLARLSVGVLVAGFFATFAGGALAFVPDGRWEGRWEPRDSCRDRQERQVTAEILDGEIHGKVDNAPGNPGTFVAEVKPNGKFIATVKGFKRDTFKVFGRVTPAEIEAKFTGRNDCGPGKIVLRPVEPDSPSAAAPETKAGQGGAPNALAALETLRAQGVITEEEYLAKLKDLAANPPAAQAAPAKRLPPDPRLRELDDLLTSGAIGADEYLARRRAITGSGD